MIELSAKVNLGGLGFAGLTNILITAKKLILLIISLCENLLRAMFLSKFRIFLFARAISTIPELI